MINLSKFFSKQFYQDLYDRFKESTLWKRIVKNFSIGISGSIVNMGLGLAKTAILTKSISVDNYGILMIVVNFYAFFNMILDVKLNDLLFRFFPEFENKDPKALEGLLNLSLVICATIILITCGIVLGLSDWIAQVLYDNSIIGPLLVIYLMAGALNVLRGFSTGILRLKDKFLHIVIPQVVGSLVTVSGLVIYIFLIGKADLYMLMVIMAIGSAISFAIPFYLSIRLTTKYRMGTGLIQSLKNLAAYRKKVISTIMQTNITSYLKLSSEKGGIFLLGVFGSSKQVALFNVAYQMVKPLKVLQGNVQPAVYPEIVKFYAENKIKQLNSLVKKVTLTTALVGICAVLFAYLLVEPVLILFTTAEYVEAIPTFMVMILTFLLSFSTLCFYPLTVVMDKLKWRNFIVSFRFLFLGAVYFIGFSAVTIAGAQFVGSLTTRLFNDIPIFRTLNSQKEKS